VEAFLCRDRLGFADGCRRCGRLVLLGEYRLVDHAQGLWELFVRGKLPVEGKANSGTTIDVDEATGPDIFLNVSEHVDTLVDDIAKLVHFLLN